MRTGASKLEYLSAIFRQTASAAIDCKIAASPVTSELGTPVKLVHGRQRRSVDGPNRGNAFTDLRTLWVETFTKAIQ